MLGQASAEHFQQCAEFPLLRNRGLSALAVTVLPIPLARRAAATACAAVQSTTEAALEIQAEFMDLCMAAREYVFLPDCTERMREGDRAWNLSYKFNSVCWRKN